MRNSRSSGMTLLEVMLAMVILSLVIVGALEVYMSSVVIDRGTQNSVVGYRACHSMMESLMGLSNSEVVGGGYLSGERRFDVKGIVGVSPLGLGRVLVEDVTSSADGGYGSGVLLRVTVRVVLPDGRVLSELVSLKYDGGGKVAASN